MNWNELEAARRELSRRAGRRITQEHFAALLGVPRSTANEWRPSGKVAAVPDSIAAHITTLMAVEASALARRISSVAPGGIHTE